jgi:general secretion pathway protein A
MFEYCNTIAPEVTVGGVQQFYACLCSAMQSTGLTEERRRVDLDYYAAMYLDFFKLQQLPFRLTADPRFHFQNTERADAKRHILAALGESASAEDDGCILVSGDAGVGKTILIHDVLDQLPSHFIVVRILQPEISVAEFHEAIVTELDGGVPASRGAGTAANLDACLANHAAQGRVVVLALDNGEVLGEELLDELLRLPARTAVAKRRLRVIFAARSWLTQTLRKPRFEGRSSRLGMHIELVPLTARETRGYVEHRLGIAGRVGGGIFGDDAFVEIQRFTGGVPRLINALADAALMAAYNRNHDSVSAFEIREAAKQLQWVEYEARTDRGEPPVRTVEEASIGHIRIEHDNKVVAEFDLPLGKINLGRSPNNDVTIDSPFVSRNHCRVVTTAHYSVIEDLQSQNGLAVASRRVSVHRLQHGDRVQLGEHTLTYTRSTLRAQVNAAALPVRLRSPSGVCETGQTGVIASFSNASARETPD